MNRTVRLGLLLVTTSILSPASASAALLAYDGIDYAPAGADLLGNNGGSGFSTAWLAGGFNASNHTNYDVQTGSLSFGHQPSVSYHSRNKNV